MNHQKEHPFEYDKMENFFSNGKLFSFIWKWRIVFIIVAAVAGLLGIIFSGPSFITPKFKSEAIIYPINLNEYSDENATEQMLQILQSTDLKLKLIDAFDLYEHYKIDQDHAFARTYMFDELNDHVSFAKTPYESVRIIVLDKDAERAAAMADSINLFYNQLVKSIKDRKTMERVERDSREMKKIRKENDSLSLVLRDIRKEYNLVNPQKQTKEITEAYLKNSGQANKMYKNLIEYRDKMIFLDSIIHFNTSRYIEFKSDHDDQLTELNRKLEFSSVISKPIPADKKSYPVRWLILAAAILSSLLFTFIVLMVIENIRKRSN